MTSRYDGLIMQIILPKGLDYYMNTAIFLPIPITVLGGLKDLPKIQILLSY